MHAQDLRLGSRITEIAPSRVFASQSKITATVEPRCEDSQVGGVLPVVVALAHANRLFQEHVADGHVGHLGHFRAWQHVGRYLHVGFDHDIGAQRNHGTVCLGRAIHVDGSFLGPLAVQDRLRRVDVGEEVVNAALQQSWGHQAWGAGKRRGQGTAVKAKIRRVASSHLSIALVLTKFGQDFGAAAFGALLLGDGIVGACQTSRDAIFAWRRAFPYALDLATVAAGELEGGVMSVGGGL